MSIPKLTQATIRRHANNKSVELGEADYQSGAVITLTQWGKLLLAEVRSKAALCAVTLQFDEVGFSNFHTNCS